jgi:hypothetical protein
MKEYEKEPDGSFCAQAAMRMGLTDCIARSAAPTGLLIFPLMGFPECFSMQRWM